MYGISKSDALDQVICDPVAFDVISTMREMVNPEPHLRAGHSKRTAEGTKNADKDWKRRGRERWLLQGLSQYYPSQETWTRASLLLEGKHKSNRSTHYDLPLTRILLSP